MKRAHRFPRRLVRWTSLCACFALASCFSAIVSKNATGTGDGSERVGIISADAPGRAGVPTARSHHARTARSLPEAGTTNAAAISDSALSALWSLAPTISNNPFLLRVGKEADNASFDFLFVPMPQAGSSKIAFTSNRDGWMQIYVMNGDGSGQARLTYSTGNDDYPRWSPNGAKILFQSDRDNPVTGYMDIYVMNPDGSGQTRLTSDPNDDSAAVWSPDGTKIVFQSFRNGLDYQVYVMNADGLNQVNLSNSSASDGEPSWSPNGTKIAFASDRDHAGTDSIYVMNSNGSGQTRLTFSADTVDDTQPVWSSDGSKIAFVSTRDSTVETWQETDDNGNVITKTRLDINKEIYVMNADGTNQTRLTNNPGSDDSPNWLPDSSKIIFRSDRDRDCCDPTAQVWMMNPDGSNQTNLSDNQFGDYGASLTSGANQPPVANAGGPYSGVTGTAVQFSGSNSTDPDGTIASYSWNFGETGSSSNTVSGVSPTHTYATAGTYTVTLTVTDNLGATNSASTTAAITGTLDARLDPLNRTGGGGEDPLSRNFNWSIPLVSLPGRAGLDLGLSLTYNSLATWTRNGNVISFDDDRGSPSPGFRLGFPVIQGVFYNSQAGKNSFIMITPSGSRVELRRVGTSALYQSVDSSYLLLDAQTMTLKTTGGTQLSYVWKNGEYECALVKDRNGNYLTIHYDDTTDRIDYIDDTLARRITFNYDGNDISSITQPWPGQTHYWARFTYANKTIQTNFTGLTVIGAQNNSTIRALTSVKLADNSHYDFDYTSWGQVWKISQYTGETSAHLLNYRSYNLRGSPMLPTGSETDCPRFTERRDWAENWNRDTNGTAQEVATNVVAPVDTALPDNSLQTVTLAKITSPDGTYQQIYFAGNISGGAGSAPAWQRGLPLLTDTFDSGNTKQRSATTAWTQDDTNVAYQLNPRVTETNITDPAGNHARTGIDYTATTLSDGTTIYLPQNTYEYQADATTQLRRTHVTYNLGSEYTSRRIIGLVSEQYLYGGPSSSETLMSKVSYQYDESGSIQGTDAPVKHENTNYTASFRVGRGNVSSVKRYDVTSSAYTTSTVQYNTAGAVVATLDPLSHGVTLSYADSFSDDGNSRNTLAYPTTVTQYPAGFSSSMKYNFDFGAPTWKRTPLPNVTDNEAGPVQTIEYDTLGRVQKVKNLFNNAYTRYEYPASQNRVDTYVTIVDTSTEAHSFKITDGHGRVIATASDHPGSTGGFSGQLIYYDTMGRVVKTSNPTETSATSSSGNPYDWPTAGDDATAGWVYTQQSYDWKGRPLVTTNPSITSNPKYTTTKSASYDGCGCAGGQVVTLTDEVGRQQKVYGDVLGRQWKREVLNSDSSVYSTTKNTFNARDQVTLVRQFQGLDTSGVYQDTTMAFDGYGRLQTKHVPEQQVDPNNSASTDYTAYTYNDDDTIHVVTDARGAKATYTYYNRRLAHTITYDAPSGVATTPDVTFVYDAVGNRTSASSSVGTNSYSYDQLSRLTSESYQFSDISGTYTLNYGYNVGGELTSLEVPFTSQSVGYSYDSAGRLSAMSASGFQASYTTPWPNSQTYTQSVSSFISSITYRAWGARKIVTYGNTVTESFDYNSRLDPTSYTLGNVSYTNTNVSPNTSSTSMGWTYDYYADGRVNHAYDSTWNVWDRSYSYDHAGRLAEADTNRVARSQTWDSSNPDPYKQTSTYDVWNNLKLTGYQYSNQQNDFSTYANNRRSDSSYDADGNVTANVDYNNALDVAAQNTRAVSLAQVGDGSTQFPHQPATDLAQSYDANGRPAKRIQVTRQNVYEPDTQVLSSVSEDTITSHYIYSSLLGAQVAEIGASGQTSVWVYAGGQRVATAIAGSSGNTTFEHHNPLTSTRITTNAHSSSRAAARNERDPQNAPMPLTNPGGANAPANYNQPLLFIGGDPSDFAPGVTLDGMPMTRSDYARTYEKMGGFSGQLVHWHLNSLGDGWFHLHLDSLSFVLPDPRFTQKKTNPQNSSGLHLGSTDQLKKQIEQTSSSCRSAVQKLLNEIAAETGAEFTSTDPLELFNQITSQTGGGGIYVDITYENMRDRLPADALRAHTLISSGSGESWYFWSDSEKNVQRMSIVYLRYNNGTPKSIGLAMAAYLVTAIHEITHIARKDHKYVEHDQMDAAAVTLGAKSFDDYIEKHCIDKQYWARP